MKAILEFLWRLIGLKLIEYTIPYPKIILSVSILFLKGLHFAMDCTLGTFLLLSDLATFMSISDRHILFSLQLISCFKHFHYLDCPSFFFFVILFSDSQNYHFYFLFYQNYLFWFLFFHEFIFLFLRVILFLCFFFEEGSKQCFFIPKCFKAIAKTGFVRLILR